MERCNSWFLQFDFSIITGYRRKWFIQLFFQWHRVGIRSLAYFSISYRRGSAWSNLLSTLVIRSWLLVSSALGPFSHFHIYFLRNQRFSGFSLIHSDFPVESPVVDAINYITEIHYQSVDNVALKVIDRTCKAQINNIPWHKKIIHNKIKLNGDPISKNANIYCCLHLTWSCMVDLMVGWLKCFIYITWHIIGFDLFQIIVETYGKVGKYYRHITMINWHMI